MISLIPSRLKVSQTIATGAKIHLQLPAICYKKTYCDFIKQNKEFHQPWVYMSEDGRYFDQYLRRVKSGKTLGFFIFTNDSDDFAGVINLNNIKLDPYASCSLGYYIDQKQCRNGYMSEAIKLVLSHAFYKIGLNRVEVNVQPENYASLALIKSLGFTKEGFSRKYLQIDNEYRDHERWAYLSGDY